MVKKWFLIMLMALSLRLAGGESGVQVILTCPTDRSVKLTVLAAADTAGKVECDGQTVPVKLAAAVPLTIEIGGLELDHAYRGKVLLTDGTQKEFSFHTRRGRGETFTFALQGDSHRERPQQNNPSLYTAVLSRVAAQNPDFYCLFGDDFNVDKLKKMDQTAVQKVYSDHEPYLSIAGCRTPLFLVNGNHEQAALANLDGTPDNVAVYAQNARQKYYPQPAPGVFYTGDAEPVAHIGCLSDYYAWEWGDALFVVLDPYWHSPQAVDNALGSRGKKRDLWANTLGETQYRWLKDTLQNCRAKYKFVLIHHVNGTGRGAMECAPFYEWGGRNRKGGDEFASRRPGWGLPIHDLLRQNQVTMVIQGHDHIFARQELDGIVYQTLPLPAGKSDALENADAYRTGQTVAGSGFVKVTVSPQNVAVEFIDGHTGNVLYQYQIK